MPSDGRVHAAVELAVVRVHGGDDAADGADHVSVDGCTDDHAADGIRALQRRLRLHVAVADRRPLYITHQPVKVGLTCVCCCAIHHIQGRLDSICIDA